MSRRPRRAEVAMNQRTIWAIGAPFASLWSAPTVMGADPGELVQGVSQIVSVGAPGPVHPLSDTWWPIVAGDEDATFPSLLAAAREYGAGRIVILGHDGIPANTDVLDNGAFMLNVMSWLDTIGTGELRYTTGHSEWLSAGSLAGLSTLVGDAGMSLSALPAPIDATVLEGVSVLIAGNAWGDFTTAEIEAVRLWVEAGGGLLLTGLGWSWEPYHPGTTIEDYPMMKLAGPYEVCWLRNSIVDPTNSYENSPVFHTFYPDIEIATIGDAIQAIETIHAAHGGQLPDALELDAELRLEFVRSHQTLAIPAVEFPSDHPHRQVVFDAYAGLVLAWPDSYARGFSFDESLHPALAWIRERAWRTWRDTVELTPQGKAQMIALGQFSGERLVIFDDFGVLLLDNDRLDGPQTDVIHDYLSLIPQDLYLLRAISVTSFLGDPPFNISLSGLEYAVNIFGFAVGAASGNQFPADIAPGLTDLFSITVAHEVNHVVDALTIGGSEALSSRRDLLIADAGDDPLNYLRSMFPPGFFTGAPGEFFASISNQWFADSTKTLELGLVRFDNGRPDPINQALFFADIYAQGGETTWFYTTDIQGHVERTSIGLTRNESGQIASMAVGAVRYEFELDAEGRVTAYSTAPAADLDGDGRVGVRDFLILLAHWGPCPDWPNTCPADLDGDGVVGIVDFLVLIAHWG
jgi:hypothetical protein